ncbi:MAG: arginine repressor [Coriobacteriales bacterium]|jgi:transcriptional regulator of arginine metabolism
MKKRDERHTVIRQIIRSENIKTQRDLVDRLVARGYQCTQATISRDISEMGLRKSTDGSYVLAEDLNLKRMVQSMVTSIERTGNLVVIKVSPGVASGVAAALDAADLPQVMGTIAGDDTILVIGRTDEMAEEFEGGIRRMHG